MNKMQDRGTESAAVTPGEDMVEVEAPTTSPEVLAPVQAAPPTALAGDPPPPVLGPPPGRQRRRKSKRKSKSAGKTPSPVFVPVPQEDLQRPVAEPASMKPRHLGLLFAFLVIVALPVLASAVYLYGRAADQYASTLGFTVRTEDAASATDLLSGLGASLGGGSASSRETDILYEFIRSQEIVRKIDTELDLRNRLAEGT